MSLDQKCRVRSLRLKAPDMALVRRGVTLLEDALHTASIPGAGFGRLVLVRTLRVGKIKRTQSPASVALEIERRLAYSGAVAVHASEPTAGSAPVVYFRDAVEPYVLLAERLARSQSVDAWFWPLAAPHWRPDMPRGEGQRRLMLAVTRAQPGVLAAARVIEHLRQHRALGGLLSALQEDDGRALMRAAGWTGPAASPPAAHGRYPGQGEEVPPEWKNDLAHWVARWGADDPRSLWLAGTVLVSENPARLLSADLTHRAERLARRLAMEPTRSYPSQSPEMQHSAQRSPASANPPGASVEESAAHSGPAGNRPAVQPGDQPSGREFQDDMPARPFTREERLVNPAPGARDGSDRRETAPPTRQGAAGETALRAPARIAEAGPDDAGPGTSAEDYCAPWQLDNEFTEYGGLFFMVQVMSRLGMASFLEAHPAWIEAQMPFRLLRYICQALPVPDHDPILAAVAVPDSAVDELPDDFMAPSAWKSVVREPAPWLIHRVAHQPDQRVLFDGSGGLLLASWRGRAPAGVRWLLKGVPVVRGTALGIDVGANLGLQAWFVAVDRWCRLYAGLEVAQVVRRPARMSTTRTHVDVCFSHRQTDVRIRKAGLDIDPGWVPWLGRVLYFHYINGDEVHDREATRNLPH